MTTRISAETHARIASLWQSILAGVTAGDPIRTVLDIHGVSVDEMRAYRASAQGAQGEWDTAKSDSADAFFDRLLEMANTRHVDPASARVNADILKWLAAKRNPRTYSDKAQLDVNVRTVDLTRIIEAAHARLAGRSAPRLIEQDMPLLLEGARLADLL